MDSKTFFSGIRTMVVQSMEKGETKDEKRAVAEQVVKLLLSAGYAVEELLKNHKVAIHRSNRDETVRSRLPCVVCGKPKEQHKGHVWCSQVQGKGKGGAQSDSKGTGKGKS